MEILGSTMAALSRFIKYDVTMKKSFAIGVTYQYFPM